MILRRLHVRLLLSVLLIVLTGNCVKSQVCTGSLGDPVINIDFGRGSAQFGPSLGQNSSYKYNNDPSLGNPNDGSYAIAKTTSGMNNGWFTVLNHTPNDPDGYMMVVNAGENRGIFYESTAAIELCQNTKYEFAAWVVNILRTDNLKPNITFVILDMDNRQLGRYDTGDIPDRNPTWKKYGFIFETTAATRVKIRMISNVDNPQHIGGNDLAIDDITFRACGPVITTKLNNTDNTEESLCEGERATYTFSADVLGSATLQYQWQVNKDHEGWRDLPNESGTSMQISFTDAEKGIYQYRFTAAEPGNFNSVNCRTVSPTLTIKVNPQPELAIASNIVTCVGDDIALNLISTGGTYAWTGPNGFTSAQKSPVISNATAAMTGLYTVVVTSPFGCVSSVQTTVDVIPRPVATVSDPNPAVCEGGSVQLEASGGTSYKWFPEEGLSDSNIANPIASPSKNTVYTVTVSNGYCETTAMVDVVIYKNPIATTGEDKKILAGNSVMIEGTAEGDEITYFWSPADDLDDPTKLNPIASPKKNTTYTLNVVSNKGCVTATSDVFIKVYEKVEVPSSFSPNGDGINDTWSIIAIDTFAEPNVKIVNRYGELIFESKGYKIPWDGKYKNQDVPPGVYYYVIQLNAGLKPLSGALTVIR